MAMFDRTGVCACGCWRGRNEKSLGHVVLWCIHVCEVPDREGHGYVWKHNNMAGGDRIRAHVRWQYSAKQWPQASLYPFKPFDPEICKLVNQKDKWASGFSWISDELQKCLQLSSHFYHYSSVPALAQALAMPLLEETTVPQEHPPTVPVVIIGKHFALRAELGHVLKSQSFNFYLLW